MPEQPSEYYPIFLDSLITGSCIDFDLYSKNRNGRYMLYCPTGHHFTQQLREKLLENGIKTLYIDISQQRTYGRYVEKNIVNLVSDPSVPSEQKADMIYSVSKGVLIDIFDNPRSSDLVQRTANITGPTIDYLLKGKDSLQNLISIMSYDYYTFTHCVNVSVFSVALANQVGNFSVDELNDLATGALMHDVGKSEIPKEILNKTGPLSTDEYEIMKQHVVFGEKIMTETHKLHSSCIIPMAQHHERVNGKGYPRSLPQDGIHLYGRIVGIVDCFDAMTTQRVYQPAKGAFEALQLMRGKLADSFDQDLLNMLISLLVKN
jgi:HD-GYP domain-containing protein (c-di-GMP phosphodiesterase class II)